MQTRDAETLQSTLRIVERAPATTQDYKHRQKKRSRPHPRTARALERRVSGRRSTQQRAEKPPRARSDEDTPDLRSNSFLPFPWPRGFLLIATVLHGMVGEGALRGPANSFRKAPNGQAQKHRKVHRHIGGSHAGFLLLALFAFAPGYTFGWTHFESIHISTYTQKI